MATNLRLTAPVTWLICLQLISTGRVCATLQPNENLSRWSETAYLASKFSVGLKISLYVPPPPKGDNPDKKSPKTTGAGGGR